MTYQSEADFERDLIQYLTEIQQWEPEVLKYKTEDELVKNWADIIFENNKERDKLNGVPLSDSEIRQIIEQVNACQSPVAINNFINCRTITIIRENPQDTLHYGSNVSLMIYDPAAIGGGKSRYQIAEQPIFNTPNPVARDRRGDFSILINGMPLIHVELKKSGVSVRKATGQIEMYTREGIFSQGIFSLVQVFVAMTPDETVYFANPGRDGRFNEKYFFHWADFDNKRINAWKDVASHLLKIPMAHQLVGYYTVADKGMGVLKVMRSYQYYAVREIVDSVKKIKWGENNLYGGYIWHTTGSGKTLTSFKCAQLIASGRLADKVVFLVDRTELGTQTFNEYTNFKNSGEKVNETDNTDHLVNLLKGQNPNDTLIVTSVQKMSRIGSEGDLSNRKRDIELINRKRLVIIIDECHRSQFGDMNRIIKLTFPGAIFFGFSGTPILAVNEKKQGKTSDVFGNELHRYTLSHAIEDGNVLGFDKHQGHIYQESEIRRIIALDHFNLTDECEVTEGIREEFYRFMNETPIIEMEKLLPDAQYKTEVYTHGVAEDILKHFYQISCGRKYHALFATSSIEEAVRYYNIFKSMQSEVQENRRLNICVLVDPNVDTESRTAFDKEQALVNIITDYNANYGKSFTMASYDRYKKDICNRLAHKKPYLNIEKKDIIDILIVVDQMLTGFDSQWINTLYLDKLLQYEGLIQAFSRTNRLADGDKPNGVIKYYRRPFQMESNVFEAVAAYSGSTAQGLFVDKIAENVAHMNSEFLIIKSVFEDENIENFSRLPESEEAIKQFVHSFNRLNIFLSRARLQLFEWEQKEYIGEDGLVAVLLFDENTYNILLQRYQEIKRGGGGGGTPDEAYDIDSYISEIKTGTINADYMQSKFIKWIGARNSAEDVERAFSELHEAFALLSQEEQRYADVVITDIISGVLRIVEGKTISDYIAEYMVVAQNTRLHRFAEMLGLDEAMLKDAMNCLTERNIDEFGILNNLKDTADKDKAKLYFDSHSAEPIKKREVAMKLDDILRRFIIQGGFEI